jgi:plastocyanin
MALNFPNTPNINDTYTDGTSTWQFDGVAWNIAPSSSASFPNSYGTVVANGTILAAVTSSDSLRINAGNNITISSDIENNTLTIDTDIDTVGFYIAADDSTQRLLSNGETVKFIGGAGIDTSSDAEGNITIVATTPSVAFNTLTDAATASLTLDTIYEPAIAILRVDNVGTTSYTFNSHYSGNNPTIYALAGTTIAFDLNAIPSLPFEIQAPAGTAYNTGVVHVSTSEVVSTGAAAQGKSSGTLYWRVPESISGNYRYQCQTQPSMVGAITIKRLSVI